ncbi:hypothetical protein K438DRAFT_1827726 [Mycena galopus ATCC 62051]|nr:hypothetical protein K438DRAFT_1827726 [Mycena galopus ATCC 62051]
MNEILVVVLAIFLFLTIPFTICIIALAIRPKPEASSGPRFVSGYEDPRFRSGLSRVTLPGSAMIGLVDNFRAPFEITAYLQFPPITLRQIGRSLSYNRAPTDPEPGTIHLQQLYIGIGHLNTTPFDAYTTRSS